MQMSAPTVETVQPAHPPGIDFYPVEQPVLAGRLALDTLHTMYFEESGNPGGSPVVYLHGGPGAGIEADMRSVHDPKAFRLVMFDQRGCGKSTPEGETRENTTWHLVADIERLREHLGIDRWIVSGGSWGCSLALAYAQRHPDRCRALVLRGVWLSTESEVQWFESGVKTFYPDVWATIEGLDEAGASVYLARLREDILNPDPTIAGPAAVRMARYEWLACSVDPDVKAMSDELTPEYCLPYQRIGAHYGRNKFFLAADQLIDGMPAIRHIPGFIINGRLDMICPPAAAYRLWQAWPRSELNLVPMAGHFSTETGIAAALLSVMEKLK
jgi:proline iminopeptidase